MVDSGALDIAMSFVTCLPDGFCPSEYKDLNPDLANMGDDEAILHYLQHGHREQRTWTLTEHEKEITKDMDCDKYLRYYGLPDPATYARGHFARHGRLERRFSFPRIDKSDITKPTDALDIDEQVHHIIQGHVLYPKLLNFEYMGSVYRDIDPDAAFNYAPEGLRYRPLRVVASFHNFIDLLKVQLETNDGCSVGVPQRILYPLIRHCGSGKRKRVSQDHKQCNKTQWPCYVINLDVALDRWRCIQSHLNSIPFLSPVIRMPAVVRSPGAFGCFLSHMKVLRQAEPGQHVIVMEDDNVIVDAIKLERILTTLETSLFTWDVFVGCNGNVAAHVQSSVVFGDLEFLKICNWTKTNFLVYNRNAVEAVLAGEDLLDDFASHLCAVDRYLNLFECYTVLGLARVTDTYSYIERTNDIKENEQINLAEELLATQCSRLQSVDVA